MSVAKPWRLGSPSLSPSPIPSPSVSISHCDVGLPSLEFSQAIGFVGDVHGAISAASSVVSLGELRESQAYSVNASVIARAIQPDTFGFDIRFDIRIVVL